MLRSASIFLAAILLPSLVLAWLAVGSARDQQVLLEHQQAVISQDVTDTLATKIRAQLEALRSEFVEITQDLVAKSGSPQAAATDFDQILREQWPPAEVGFAVDLHGKIYSPTRDNGTAERTFRDENERFLSNRENVEVYSSLQSQNFLTKQMIDRPGARGGFNGYNNASGLADADATAGEKKRSALAYSDKEFAPKQPADQLLPAAPIATSKAETSKVASGALRRKSSVSADVSSAPADALVPQVSQVAAEKNKDLEEDSLKKDQAGFPPAAPAAAALPEPVAAPRPAPDYRSTVPGNAPAESAAPVTTSAPPPMAKVLAGYNQSRSTPVERQVSPQNNVYTKTTLLSNTLPEESDFRRLIGSDTSGALARFLDNKLRLMVWYRSTAESDLVFGAQLNQRQLQEKLRALVESPEPKGRDSSSYPSSSETTYCVALLDDLGHPVALSIPGFKTDWKHPFVATEIGDTLPHWEAALYLLDPQQMSKSARTLQLTLGLIVLVLVVAIVAGGSLIAADIRRQVRLAQQKTDFVSNVSHELKTPLTSIRMFADLLAEGRVTEPERQSTYLKIISAESARLTRLINNVLDFARLERGAPGGEKRPCDLVETTRDVVETCLPHLEAGGQNMLCEIEAEELPISGDRDAIAQIVLNLVSNAEKYGGGEILVRVRRQETAAGALGCIDVLDRGPGVPPKEVESIFLPFHRLNDSLSSGIPGSGLGLTLSRRMARVHGGDITYTPRAGGGSCFTLALPLTV